MICKKSFTRFNILLGTLATLAIPNISLAQVYNAATNFDAGNNPTAANFWSYGYETTLGGVFNLFSSRFETSPGLDSWAIVSTPYPYVYPRVVHNGTTNILNWDEMVVNPNVLLLHPGPMNEYAVVRWKAHNSGRYSIEFTYTGFESGVSTDVHLLFNNAVLFSSSIDGVGDTAYNRQVLSLNYGDMIDFAVGYGRNSSFNSDVTRLDAQIQRIGN
jgi:hypothetical protein